MDGENGYRSHWWRGWRRMVFWLLVAGLGWLILELRGQTTPSATLLDISQIRGQAAVLEFSQCKGSVTGGGTGAGSNCLGLYLLRFRMRDGTATKPFVAVPYQGTVQTEIWEPVIANPAPAPAPAP